MSQQQDSLYRDGLTGFGETVFFDRAASTSRLEQRVVEREFTASDIRRIFQQLFPQRRLVLSQFTFFSQAGVAKATGETFRRGRRCYRLEDMLSIACVIALKEEGIPLKNVEALPKLLQENSGRIFKYGAGCRLSGCGENLALVFPDDKQEDSALAAYLDDESSELLLWGFDVGLLSEQLRDIAEALDTSDQERVAA